MKNKSIYLLLSILIFINQALAAPTITRGPYLQKATPSSIIVRWRTNEATDSAVRFGARSNRINKKISINESTIEHRVEISKLKSSTKYFYTVGTNQKSLFKANSATYFTTQPIIGNDVTTRIWAIGDTGLANQGQVDVYHGYLKYISKTKKRADVWLMLGDNAYETGKDEEFRQVFLIFMA